MAINQEGVKARRRKRAVRRVPEIGPHTPRPIDPQFAALMGFRPKVVERPPSPPPMAQIPVIDIPYVLEHFVRPQEGP